MLISSHFGNSIQLKHAICWLPQTGNKLASSSATASTSRTATASTTSHWASSASVWTGTWPGWWWRRKVRRLPVWSRRWLSVWGRRWLPVRCGRRLPGWHVVRHGRRLPVWCRGWLPVWHIIWHWWGLIAAICSCSVAIITLSPVVRNRVGSVSAIVIVMIDIVPAPIVNNYIIIPAVVMPSVITSMTIVMVTTIYANRHNSCKSKPRWIIAIVVRRCIRNICGRIHVLYNRRGLNNLYRSCWGRYGYKNRIFTLITGVGSNRRISFWLNNIILTVQFFIANNL